MLLPLKNTSQRDDSNEYHYIRFSREIWILAFENMHLIRSYVVKVFIILYQLVPTVGKYFFELFNCVFYYKLNSCIKCINTIISVEHC